MTSSVNCSVKPYGIGRSRSASNWASRSEKRTGALRHLRSQSSPQHEIQPTLFAGDERCSWPDAAKFRGRGSAIHMAFKSMSKEHGQPAAVVQVHVGEHHGIDPAPIDLRKRQISLLVFPDPRIMPQSTRCGCVLLQPTSMNPSLRLRHRGA